MTAKQAKYLLQFVPKRAFITGTFTNRHGKCCAVGHLMRLTGNRDDYSFDNCSGFSERSKALSIYTLCYKKAKELMGPTYVSSTGDTRYTDLAGVNNHKTKKYQQDHPKDRVMALLDDMIAAGY